jgi:radial spoke head protein 9
MRDVTKSVIILRNQYWPGYYAYHRTNTPIFGGLYIGDGLQNVDLPFML